MENRSTEIQWFTSGYTRVHRPQETQVTRVLVCCLNTGQISITFPHTVLRKITLSFGNSHMECVASGCWSASAHARLGQSLAAARVQDTYCWVGLSNKKVGDWQWASCLLSLLIRHSLPLLSLHPATTHSHPNLVGEQLVSGGKDSNFWHHQILMAPLSWLNGYSAAVPTCPRRPVTLLSHLCKNLSLEGNLP